MPKRNPGFRVKRAWAAALAGAGAAAGLHAAAPGRASEYEVKAAFLFNFSKYVEWPAGTFAGTDDPIFICVLGANPFGTLLADDVRNKKVNGRDLAVRNAKSLAETAGCHIVFISATEQALLDEALVKLAGRPVLTVGDAESASERGVVLGLTLKGARVRFEVNLAAARRAGLKLSSQLLKLASRLIGQGEEGAR